LQERRWQNNIYQHRRARYARQEGGGLISFEKEYPTVNLQDILYLLILWILTTPVPVLKGVIYLGKTVDVICCR
jgi:hypothetical protein